MQALSHRWFLTSGSRAQAQGFAGFFAIFLVIASASPEAFAQEKAHKPTATAPAQAITVETKEIKPGLAGSFLSGRFARRNQDLKEAAKYVGETLARDPANEHLQHEAMRLNLLAGNIAEATALAKNLTKSSEPDPLVSCLLMLDLVKAGDFKQAKVTINNAPAAGLFGLIRPVVLQWIDVASGEKTLVDMQPAIDKSGFFAPFLTYHGALMNDVLGNTTAASTAYAKAGVDPAVTPYRVVEAIANFDARQGKWDEAQAVYDAYAKANPNSSLIPDRLTPGVPPKPLVANATEGLAELFFTTASILFGDDSTQDTFLYLRIALELRPDLPPAQLMLANLHEQVEDYKQAIATYDAIAEGNVFYRRGQVRKALNYEALGQRDQAILLLDGLAKKYPKESTALITKADMLREAKDYTAAAEAYTAAIARTEPMKPADWPLLYARGISYERAGKWDMAEADFNQALSLQPNQPDVLNYLAYSWLTMGKNMDKAREYLQIASQERPDDAHIMDSIGWSYYLSGDFKTAVQSFEKAVELMPDDPTVNDHLGDAYWRTGRIVEARYQWERALTFKPEPEVAELLRNKIDKGLPALAEDQSLAKPSSVVTAPAKTQVQ